MKRYEELLTDILNYNPLDNDGTDLLSRAYNAIEALREVADERDRLKKRYEPGRSGYPWD